MKTLESGILRVTFLGKAVVFASFSGKDYQAALNKLFQIYFRTQLCK
ncbi:hypothetical protein VCHE16_0218 [Vibrio paracholerae HE-16]|nr:hypothetical protein VCHE16_0218 [Vibrio paracholerae HE-16]